MKYLSFNHHLMTNNQLNNSYLLCLAMLNFDHQVHVIFTDHCWHQIAANKTMKKKWLALKLYGAKDINQLVLSHNNDSSTLNQDIPSMSLLEFEVLKNHMDLVS